MNAMFNTRPVGGEPHGLTFLHQAQDRRRLAISTLDVLSHRICVIDRAGRIVMANRAWHAFYEENFQTPTASHAGLSYFDCPECTGGHELEQDMPVLRHGIQSVMEGSATEFISEYRLAVAGQESWFRVRVSNFPHDAEYLVVVHEDITKYKKHEAALLEMANELRGLATHLQSVKESERKRIARELHDELGQHLLCMKMDVSVLHEGTNGINPRFNARLGQVLKCIDGTMEMVKSIINDLRPAALDLGLAAAIRAHALSFQRRTGIFCELLLEEGAADTNSDRMTTLFRVVQESLVNVARHSNASRVRICLREDSGGISIRVSDNGKGMPEGIPSRRGKFGLVGMRERINACGGKFSIEQVAEGGTCISASIPI